MCHNETQFWYGIYRIKSIISLGQDIKHDLREGLSLPNEVEQTYAFSKE